MGLAALAGFIKWIAYIIYGCNIPPEEISDDDVRVLRSHVGKNYGRVMCC